VASVQHVVTVVTVPGTGPINDYRHSPDLYTVSSSFCLCIEKMWSSSN
jgi:hypothetical protein